MTALDQLMPIERAAVVATAVLFDVEAEDLAADVRPSWPTEEPTYTPGGVVYMPASLPGPHSRGWFQ
ncbi:hypothetical protein JNUCC0626_18490 [Lentzea sp. JNUCC 0626]|uniref:hypothetical protein n=1 Tax=Lentzea sp. JNUCC 0626 TaxID=3367513 RepID=UPI003748273D